MTRFAGPVAGRSPDGITQVEGAVEMSQGPPRAAASVAAQDGSLRGVGMAVLASALFGTSGPFAKSLIEAGWSPAAAVVARIGGAALVLALPALRALGGRWGLLRRHARLIVAYGVVGGALTQLCYFNAVSHLSVGVALLLEFLGVVLVVGWLWWRTGARPGAVTGAGVAASMAGLVVILDVGGSARVSAIGVAWALGAAVALAGYFVLASHQARELPGLVMVAGGLTVAAALLGALGALRLLPMTFGAGLAALGGREVSPLVPLAGLVVLSTALAYTTGLVAARRLGAKVAGFVSLVEVVFAVLVAWILLGELPRAIQLLGGALIIVGAGLVKYDEMRASGG